MLVIIDGQVLHIDGQVYTSFIDIGRLRENMMPNFLVISCRPASHRAPPFQKNLRQRYKIPFRCGWQVLQLTVHSQNVYWQMSASSLFAYWHQRSCNFGH